MNTFQGLSICMPFSLSELKSTSNLKICITFVGQFHNIIYFSINISTISIIFKISFNSFEFPVFDFQRVKHTTLLNVSQSQKKLWLHPQANLAHYVDTMSSSSQIYPRWNHAMVSQRCCHIIDQSESRI